MKAIPVSIFLVLMLVATTGRSNKNDAIVAPVAAPDGGKLIEYYGDSTILGIDGSAKDSTTVQYPAPAFVHVSGYQVVNLGVGGQTAMMLLNGDDKGPDWNKRMTASRAYIVVLNYGLNDSRVSTLAEYSAALTGLARTARKHGKRVFFETPNPAKIKTLPPYVNAMRSIAENEGVEVIDQYQYLKMLGKKSTGRDGVHPDQGIYQIKGQVANSVLNTVLLR